MVVPTHWDGSGNGGTGGDRVIYRPLPEYGSTINCDSSYHGLVPGGGADQDRYQLCAFHFTGRVLEAIQSKQENRNSHWHCP